MKDISGKPFKCAVCNENLIIRSGHDLRVFHTNPSNDGHYPKLKQEDRTRLNN